MAHKNKSNWSPYSSRQKKSGKPLSKQGKHRISADVYSDPNEIQDRFRDLFERHGIDGLQHETRLQFARFYLLMMEHQKTVNMTRLLTLKDVGIKHFVDCLLVPEVLQNHGSRLLFPLLDVGSGPGFPGIPLKLIHPQERIILAEGVQRRVEFLKLVRDSLSLSTESGPLDILGRNINDEVFLPVQGVITRAVEDASNTLGNVIHCLQTGGKVFLMKGPNCTPEIEPAIEKWGEYFKLSQDLAYEIPATPFQRRLLVFEKIKPYPLPSFEDLDLKWEKQYGE